MDEIARIEFLTFIPKWLKDMLDVADKMESFSCKKIPNFTVKDEQYDLFIKRIKDKEIRKIADRNGYFIYKEKQFSRQHKRATND